jgi:hypothetical protein
MSRADGAIVLFVDSRAATKSRSPSHSPVGGGNQLGDSGNFAPAARSRLIGHRAAFAADTNDHYRQLIGKSNRAQ